MVIQSSREYRFSTLEFVLSLENRAIRSVVRVGSWQMNNVSKSH